MHGIAFSQNRPVVFVQEYIVETQPSLSSKRKGGFDSNDIVIAGWIVVTTIGLIDRKETALLFQ